MADLCFDRAMRSLASRALGRLVAACVLAGSLGCSSGEATADPSDGMVIDEGVVGDTLLDLGTDGASTDAKTDAPTDVAAEASDGAAEGGPTDTGSSIEALCAGVDAASFQPPATCDASSGNTSTEVPKNRIYSTSWFGCYRKADGTIYKDPSDNCLFACGSKGLCAAGLSGPECEATLEWFAADADRYSCGGRIRVTNCTNKKQVVLTTLDRGPNCKTVEKPIGAPVLDMSHSAMVYLFDGKTYGGSDKKRVIVEAVSATATLGPVK